MVTDILAFCAAAEHELPRSALEVLACARQVADAWGEARVRAVLFGNNVASHAQTLIAHGADQVLTVNHPRLTSQAAEPMLGVLEQLARAERPAAVLLPNDLLGGEITPRLAWRLDSGAVTDCIGVEPGRSPDEVRWVRPTHGGKAVARMTIIGPIQIATVRSRAFEPRPADPARAGEVVASAIDVKALPNNVTVVDEVTHESEGIPLEQAQIIVSGGRGMGDAKEFVHLRKLADLLGGAVAGSRAAADAGWVSHDQLVGQTGKIVAPKVYLAVGISGAPQHMSGIISAKSIVAINTDEEAPIFKAAHLGVVGDWREVLPAFTAACEQLRGGG
ncbi:MAG: electron transfer flavoprotein subunit alpha/FixB family protein [Chloroflexi bacterium]|nr:electron transfer flavoprotein subunit alpha/FixB family protein [Chloroflexota bacterium]